MYKRTASIIFCCLFICTISSAQKLQLDSINSFIQKFMVDFEVPGLAIGIVRNDSILFSKGYGTREIHNDLPVNENTIFGIGSVSKSFTALTVGILVQQGKIHWDDRVRDYLPYFELYDPYVTETFTIRDLLTHRSGLKRVSGGILWYHSDLTRTEIIKQLKYLKPTPEFRSKAAYQNIMYLVAGEIVKEVSGTSWDEFLQSKVLTKLNMKNSTSIYKVRETNKNLAQPHIMNESFQKIAVIQENGDNLAAGGFIYSSVQDMSNYMRLLLNNGIFNDDTIIEKRELEEILKPQIHFPMRHGYNEFTSYGLGWWLTPENGHKIIEHSGGIDGMTAHLMMIKDMNLGVVVLINTSEPVNVLTNKIIGQILNESSFDLYKKVKSERDNKIVQKRNNTITLETQRIKSTFPSQKIESYTGTYTDDMYGKILIKEISDKHLEISFSHTPLFSGKLKHWHYDTFLIDWYDIRVPNGFLTFNFDAKHNITGFSLEQENLLDVDFSELTIRKDQNNMVIP